MAALLTGPPVLVARPTAGRSDMLLDLTSGANRRHRLTEPVNRTCTAAAIFFYDGNRTLLHTGGVTGTRDSEGTFHPLAERLAKWSGHDPGPLPQEIVADSRRLRGRAAPQ